MKKFGFAVAISPWLIACGVGGSSPSGITCQAGMHAESNKCVPNCGEGTEQRGDQCVAKPPMCQPGEVIRGNVCVRNEPPGECVTGGQCPSGICQNNMCLPATCTDKLRNGMETDVDCGGPTCPICKEGQWCQQDSDCPTHPIRCENNKCTPFRPNGQVCRNDELCWSKSCIDDICQAPTCGDGKQNGEENGIDCHDSGHPMGPCLKCNNGDCDPLKRGADCQSGCCAYITVEYFCAPATEC